MEYELNQSYVNKHSNGMAIAALALGIAGLVMSFCIYPGFILGSLGIIFGILSRGGEITYPGYGKAGIVLGILAIFISIIAIFVWASLFSYVLVYGKYF